MPKLVEQATKSFVSGLLSLFFLVLLLVLSGLRWRSLSGGSNSGRSVGVRVGDAVLEVLYLGPAVLSLNRDSQNLLVAVNHRVHDRRQGGEVGSKRDASNGGDSARESLKKLTLLDVENAWREGVALVVNLRDAHSVGEGRDIQHVEQGSLRRSDLVSCLNELQICCDFDGTAGDLGGDSESLEERSLSGFHARVSGGDVDIGGSKSTSTSRGSNLVGENLVTDDFEVAIGEDESDVALDEWEEALVLGGIGDEALDGASDLWNIVSFGSFNLKPVGLLTMVFFPIRTMLFTSRNDTLISCICCD
jgi:hypothetical protein